MVERETPAAAAVVANSPVIYLVVCGADPAAQVPAFLALAREAGWTVCVTATAPGTELLPVDEVAALASYPLRLTYDKPSLLWPLADLVLVAPATFNTVNKFAAGIADSIGLSLLAECLGMDVPVLVVPNVNPALARHPRYRCSIDELRRWGVDFLFDPAAEPPVWMPTWPAIVQACEGLLAPGRALQPPSQPID